MLFNSVQFLMFFLGLCLCYYLMWAKARPYILLIASYGFYLCWNPKSILFLIGITLFSYFFGLLIGSREKRGALLAFSVTALLLPLLFFKYRVFFALQLSALLAKLGLPKVTPLFAPGDLITPVGISFITFMALGYLIDVCRGKILPERNFFHYALFLSFFPGQAAGPISRADSLLPQFKARVTFHSGNITDGALYMLYGYLQKLVIADTLAGIVGGIYEQYQTKSALILLLGMLLYSIEIYADFAGYSNIALGCAKMLGIDLIKNFQAPYMAQSIAGFWRGWHISLTSWFRDYLYIPLGGNRKGKLRQYLNILIVFSVSGLWHGAGTGYVAWGLLNGLYQVIGRALAAPRDALVRLLKIDRSAFSHRLLKRLITFSLVTVSWVFFRAESFRVGLDYLSYIGKNLQLYYEDLYTQLLFGLTPFHFFLLSLCILLQGCVDFYVSRGVVLTEKIRRQGLWFRYLVYLVLIFAVLILGRYGSGFDASSFIYLQY